MPKVKNISKNKIKKIFKSFEIDLKVNDNNFHYILLNYLTTDDNSEKNKIFLLDRIKKLDPNTVNFYSWIRLRDLFYLKSRMVLGGICRKKAISATLNSKTNFFLSKKNKLRSRLNVFLDRKM